MKPYISIIIPTYNRLGTLAELLEALSKETYTDFEVIIVNDGGDPVDEVVELYTELRITLVNQTANLKHVHARNRGLQEASGEWIMLCDDDDLVLPGHLERMLVAAEDADLVYSDVEIVDFVISPEDGVRYPVSRRLFAYELDMQGMRAFSTFVASGCLYRRSLHDQIGRFDVEMYHYWDWDFFLRVADSFRVKRLPVASALYAFGDSGQHLSDDLGDMRPYLNRLCEKHQLGDLPTKNFFLLLEEPEVKRREAVSQLIWDGQPFRSRWHQ